MVSENVSFIHRSENLWTSFLFLFGMQITCVLFIFFPGFNAPFDPEGLIFAAGINSESLKLYDLRSFDKLCSIFRDHVNLILFFCYRFWIDKLKSNLFRNTGEPGLSSQVLSPQSNPGASSGGG